MTELEKSIIQQISKETGYSITLVTNAFLKANRNKSKTIQLLRESKNTTMDRSNISRRK